jgi:hypothetical protein
MISCQAPRHWIALLLLYVALDFMDPSIPGVFFFDTQAFFVDGVVQTKSSASSNLVAAEPTPLGGSVDYDDGNGAARRLTSARPQHPPQARWKNLTRDDSASFASSSPRDSPPTPPQS